MCYSLAHIREGLVIFHMSLEKTVEITRSLSPLSQPFLSLSHLPLTFSVVISNPLRDRNGLKSEKYSKILRRQTVIGVTIRHNLITKQDKSVRSHPRVLGG